MEENGAVAEIVETIPDKSEMSKAPEVEVLAVQLHEARSQNFELRNQLINLQQALVEKEKLILELEKPLIEGENKALRDKHKLTVGTSFQRDPDTGDYYRVNRS